MMWLLTKVALARQANQILPTVMKVKEIRLSQRFPWGSSYIRAHKVKIEQERLISRSDVPVCHKVKFYSQLRCMLLTNPNLTLASALEAQSSVSTRTLANIVESALMRQEKRHRQSRPQVLNPATTRYGRQLNSKSRLSYINFGHGKVR